jgi:acetyl-CoA decarbonylase/synthase complex subunit delta
MAEIPSAVEKWAGKIEEVEIGALQSEGGTRKKKYVTGGVTTLPFLYFDGKIPKPPYILMEVYDITPEYPDVIKNIFQDVFEKPVEWSKKCITDWNADMVALKLKGADPEGVNRSAEECADIVEKVLKSIDVPIFIYGCGNEEKDTKIFQACGDIIKNERCVIGSAESEKYKSISAAAMAYDQSVVAFSNLDINLAKQLNILLTDFGVKKNRIIMDPLQGALGYGLDYSYSVIERIRLAALQGDTMLQMPIICDASIAWNARESYTVDEKLGEVYQRGILWEAITALSAIMAGADLIIMRHPTAVNILRNTVYNLKEERGE